MNMKLPKGVDLTNDNQKILAGFLLVIAIAIFWMLLPSLVWFFKNVVFLIILLIVVGFFILNYDTVWHNMKQLSWELTKASIKKNKPSYLWRFHEYVVKKVEALQENARVAKSGRLQCEQTISTAQADMKDELQFAETAERKGSRPQAALAAKKAKLKESLIQKLLPRYEILKTQENTLMELLRMRTEEAEDLKVSIESMIEEWEILKNMDEAIANSGAATNDSNEMKLYKEALKQMENDIFKYTANIEMFDTKIKPVLERASIQNEANDEAALQLLEEYKANRFIPDFKKNTESLTTNQTK